MTLVTFGRGDGEDETLTADARQFFVSRNRSIMSLGFPASLIHVLIDRPHSHFGSSW